MRLKDIFQSNKKMQPKVFGLLILGIIAASLITAGFSFLFGLLNLDSFTVVPEVKELANPTFLGFLKIVLLAPVCEELLYRGILTNVLKRRGELFAIIVSALIFGIAHGNVIQGIKGFLCGLLFGYTFLEYSLTWSIALHVINNIIFFLLYAVI